ncbi:ABC drug exporter AtrF [Pyrenophora tritici-repentis]|uniref:ABC drug exporter AtrF n=2 Tax=Pyrenophora tritici-repentis TaxID=45151 RepID=A0A2W1F406_9PLEO|nr:ABC drug exporter AtrF [Pyrenophora tritici-repentis Pt-1C-BFP]KAA8626036.1 ABC drug exporter AtrF [Pyrenophora tritici-repentis]EDU40824.1 ABC drug exporter AtrF [Pyrenophora tritici-repentis Pt-1C-BFP]KAG9388197.1 ABC drug exporter AtrF [Pyrenophora tritici-repentis]KAI1513506.1 ABC drug exporter AtrF [Pyrenophora tritici-repentis]KAI1544791.1 CcmA ABC-type multidrug transport system ATPase component [Pyrenophora tritici-repentis]
MASNDATPGLSHLPGGWIETPADPSRQQSYIGSQQQTHNDPAASYPHNGTSAHHTVSQNYYSAGDAGLSSASSNSTAVASTDAQTSRNITNGHQLQDRVTQGGVTTERTRSNGYIYETSGGPVEQQVELEHDTSDSELEGEPTATKKSGTATRPSFNSKNSRLMTEEDLFRALSRRRTSQSNGLSKTNTGATGHSPDEEDEINNLMSKMFGRTRQEASEEEKTRHQGVIFKHLTVKGMGLGAALQPSVGALFLDPVRFTKNLLTKGPRQAAGKPPVRTILDDFSGCIRPGEMVLVLGRPGSGCSTFLKMIGNQRYGFEEITGKVSYGGTDADEMAKKYRSEVLYNPEDDLHYATLKVKDTLKFALKTRTPGKESRKEGESRNDYVNEFLRVVTKLFWIEHTLGTKVGNELIRGVSGGEKKRVSIAEAMITKASVQSWDNSTRGLDASTALEYVQSLRSLTNMAQISCAIALYQAGESLYDLFDKVLLIHEGRCCYFGPTEKAADYFKSLGFVKPDRWTTSDFLTSVTDEHERQVKEGWEDRIPRTGAAFGEAFANSEQANNNFADIEEFEKETKRQAEQRHEARTKATKKKNFTISFPEQVMACTKRQFLVMVGDPQSLVGKWGGIFFQALIVGSLFYNLPNNAQGVFPRGGVIFFMLLFNALLALAELTAAFESRPILLKHASFSFYRPAAYAIAQTVIDVPLVLIQVIIFDVVVYFMANLSRTASQFFISVLFLWIITMTMYAFFRAIGSLVGSLDVATRITGVAVQALVVYTGYLIPPRKMHPWFSWLRWVNPIQYGFEGLLTNEFYNLEIDCVPPFIAPQVPNAQEQYQSCAIQGNRPGSLTVAGSDYIAAAYGYSRTHLWRNFGLICAFFLFFVALTAFGMEIQKPNKGGGAVTIYKRGQVPKTIEKEMETKTLPKDEESGNKEAVTEKHSSSDNDESDKTVEGVAKNETIFTFQDITYTIPYEKGERTLLSGVQGFVKPGKLTALMGASGAGKTTLLNTLAQRINFGVVRGDFLVDGKPLPHSFQRSTGFAEQMDVHESTATVREALQFSARLRQPKEVPIEEKYEYVEKIIDLLEMRDIAGAAIGTTGNGLNQEQRKRLTIGVELASKPELLMFLDEPTSGLDSGAAFNIVRFLHKLADAGQAILCTIHQPSAVLFEHFDQLLLLKSGGRTVYFGDLGHDSQKLIGYLQDNGAEKCPPNTNPAEYMLEVIGAGNPDYKGKDWADVWEKSSENGKLTQEIQEIITNRRNAAKNEEARDDREYAMPYPQQWLTVVKRSFVAIWRDPPYVQGMVMLHIITGLFNGFTFWNLGQSQIDMQSRLFSVFMTLTIAPPLIQQLQPRFISVRGIYESREGSAKIYAWTAMVWGTILSELPYRIVSGTIYWCCWYFPPGFPRDTYTAASVWLFVMLFEIFYLGFGQAIASFAPNELLASLLVPLFFTFIVSFCGVVVPYASLPSFWQSWMYWLTPFKYLLEGFLALLVEGQVIRCDSRELAIFPPPPGQSCQTYAGQFARQSGGYVETQPDGNCGFCQYATGEAFAASFNVFPRYIWRDFGIMWAYIFFNFAVVFVCTWLYLGGLRQMKTFFSPAARKQKKEMKSKQGGDAA